MYQLSFIIECDLIDMKQKNKKLKEKFGSFRSQIKDLKRYNKNRTQLYNKI